MPTAAAHRRSIAGIASGAFAVLAVAFLMLFLGGSPASAADDDSQGAGGLLGALGKAATTVVSPVVQTVSPVIETVAPIVGTVADAADAVVTPVAQATGSVVGGVVGTTSDAAASVPVVGPTAGAALFTVAGAVSETITGTAGAVSTVLQDAPVATLTDPLLDLVSAVPLVGDIVEDSGARGLAESVVGVVDDTAADAGGVIDHVVPPVGDAVDPRPAKPTVPGEADGDFLPQLPGVGGPADPAEHAVLTASSSSVALGASTYARATWGSISSRAAPASYAAETGAAGSSAPAHAPPAHAPPAPAASSSAHSGGASFHDGARPPAPSSGALGLSERTPHSSGDDLPAAPVADTDVSPD